MKKRDDRRAPLPHGKGRPQNAPRASGGGGGGGSSIWLYGIHAVSAALANPERRIRRLVATTEAAKSLPATKIPVETMERAEIDRLLAPGSVHQGIALLVEPLPAITMEDIIRMADSASSALVLVLDQVTDPHNVGAILRSAAAFGALAVVAPDRHAPDETGTLAKSASGALERMPLVRVTNVVRALEDMKKGGFWTAGLAADAPKTLAEAELSGKVVLVLGAEGEGMRRLTREHCDHLVRLPMCGEMESLNVSNAAAVALYEIRREG
ncbi:23S rRNA (guanosine-2'-O-) -methyltransferase rlmB [Paramagnetospirillum magnetotacticum MS-1]|uniref:23S rRNA (Guanosine-2'-O-)-methyltransferase rlmB n=1 Tax=Paramagnetospirillum magnetotacticum MS-1 TaxID=272627 RepID=A0A0C2YY37_PARME|nr:23S rRNA (guanosine(2251)-2'-O)-methyltransferase RlmB [Paramagnetospirillum magnetotacticum]KIM00009.1 23S rRNA (guanosine-2'-O-) -methyltransferase rlmB [Paramagnetospirillum magnetotacticum MS-1]